MILLLLKEKQSCERSSFRYLLQLLCFVTIYKSRQIFGIIVQNSDKQAIFLMYHDRSGDSNKP